MTAQIVTTQIVSAQIDERPESRTVLMRMRSVVPALPESEKRVALAFLETPAEAAVLSIAQLAARCAVSTTTVVRFARRIGYQRYQDLRMDLTRESTRETLSNAALPAATGDISRDDSLEQVVAKVASNETLSIADTAEALDIPTLARAVQAVLDARRTDIFGIGASSFVGLDLQQKLTRIGRTALAWPDTHSAWTSAVLLDSSCVALAVSHSGSTVDTVEFLRSASKAGATTIALTNFASSPLAEAADIVLTTAARETRFRSGALGSRIAQLMVVDCLFTGVAQASFDDSVSALQKTYSALHRRPTRVE